MDSGDTRLQFCPVRSSRGDLVMPPCWVNRGFISGLFERMGGLGILSPAKGSFSPRRKSGILSRRESRNSSVLFTTTP